tara:strand:+ start:4327 stop:5631 length:1305 start_codon:yes stop_codon:yes gene_type:complete
MTDRQNVEINSSLASTQTCDPIKMEERSGYKKTKLGWLPKEWEVVKLKDISGSFSGGTPSKSKPEFYGGNIHWIKSGELNQGMITNTSEFISELGLLSSSAKIIKPETLLIAMYGATAGVVAISKIEGAINQAVLALILSKKTELHFMYNYLKMRMPKIVQSLVQGGQPNLSGGIINKLNIVLPPLPEQQKIATILSTWDSAIAKQEQLITAKQEFKKGLMQLLLTGKKRFEGFEGEWESKTLNECCSVKGKYGINAAAVPYKTELPRYLRITDIDDSGNYSPDKEVSVDDPTWSEYVLEDGDIVFARTGNTTGKTYLYDSADGELVFAGFLIKFKPDPRKLNPYFLKYFTNSTAYWKWIEVMSVRSGQPGINSNEYGKLNIKLPSLTEQQKIASVLSAADKEIGLLQSELATLRGQKRGLMQRLLTGEVRVEI